jgi:hypothetical protein
MASDRKTPQPEDDLFDWFTISYRSIAIAVVVLVAMGVGGLYYFFGGGPPPPPPETEATRPSVTSARFQTIEGSVKVKAVGTVEWLVADTSMVLRKSDLVRTGPGGAAEIQFFDGTTVHVRPDSLITIEETSEDPTTRRRKVAWFISSGEVNFKASRPNVPGSQTEASTPTTRTSFKEDAAGDIRVADSGQSDLKLFAGSAQVTTKSGDTVALVANRAVSVDEAGKAGPEQSLPPPPALRAPSHQAEITYPDPSRATTLLVWAPVPGAVGYHVMLDYSPHFNRPLLDRTKYPDTSVELQGLDVGKFYWKVSAVGKESVEGPFSAFAKFTVTRPPAAAAGSGPPPPLQVPALEARGNIVQVKGRTEPGANVTVNSQRVDVGDDGTFNEFITLPTEKPGRQEVLIRSVGLNGGVNTQRRWVTVGEQ